MIGNMFWDEETKFAYKALLVIVTVILVAMFVTYGVLVYQKQSSANKPTPIVSEMASPSKAIDINVNVN